MKVNLHKEAEALRAMANTLDDLMKKEPPPDDERTRIAKELCEVATKNSGGSMFPWTSTSFREAYLTQADYVILANRRAALGALDASCGESIGENSITRIKLRREIEDLAMLAENKETEKKDGS